MQSDWFKVYQDTEHRYEEPVEAPAIESPLLQLLKSCGLESLHAKLLEHDITSVELLAGLQPEDFTELKITIGNKGRIYNALRALGYLSNPAASQGEPAASGESCPSPSERFDDVILTNVDVDLDNPLGKGSFGMVFKVLVFQLKVKPIN